MEKIGIVKGINEIYNTVKYLDGYILGVKNLSVNLPFYFALNDLGDIIEFLNKEQKKIYISLNKNIHNEDLEYLNEVLKFLENYNIDGIMYYDMALITLKNNGLTSKDLIWSQEHLTCNYSTINFYNKLGVDKTVVSSEITLDEIKDIKKNTTSKIFVQMFGYIPMFTSRRNLVNNYIDTFNLKKSKNYRVYKEGYYYHIINHDNITEVYSGNIINGLKESVTLKDVVDYVILSSAFIKDSDFLEIIKLYSDSKNIELVDNLVDKLFDNVDKGFLYKETIYKVKRK